MFINEAKPALDRHSGGNGMIEVDEFPTENIQDNVIYHTQGNYTDVNVYIKSDDTDAYAFTLTSVIQNMMEVVPDIKYYIVNDMPSTPNMSDLQTFTELHVYINNDIPYVYGDVGYGNMWLNLATIANSVSGSNLENRGFDANPCFVSEAGLYVSYKNESIGLSSSKCSILINNGGWNDYEKIFNKTITTYKNDKLTQLHPYAFYQCYDLRTVDLPNVDTVGDYAFERSGLTSIKLGKTRIIYNGVFSECYYLTDIHLGSNEIVALWDSHLSNLSTKQGYINIHVRPELVETYNKGYGWVDLVDEGKVVIIGDYVD